MKKILITGANGFIGKNLIAHLAHLKENYTLLKFSQNNNTEDLSQMINEADFIYHLAGANRPKNEDMFKFVNIDLTETIINILKKKKKPTPILFTSSSQADQNNPYGISKRKAEKLLIKYSAENNGTVFIFRLPNVFGKWSKPNYNSAIATFCHNHINNIRINIHDENAKINLVYIDDLIQDFISLLHKKSNDSNDFIKPSITYNSTVGELVNKIQSFSKSRSNLFIEDVGVGLSRALYSTYLSFLEPNQFSYPLTKHLDKRGSFCEILKTKENGQFSFFTAKPGETRGGHYHHSKNEKFIVLEGNALFRFKNILTGELFDKKVSSEETEVIETIPGWAHNIKNTGNSDLIVMLWANEIFNKEIPDTYFYEI